MPCILPWTLVVCTTAWKGGGPLAHYRWGPEPEEVHLCVPSATCSRSLLGHDPSPSSFIRNPPPQGQLKHSSSSRTHTQGQLTMANQTGNDNLGGAANPPPVPRGKLARRENSVTEGRELLRQPICRTSVLNLCRWQCLNGQFGSISL